MAAVLRLESKGMLGFRWRDGVIERLRRVFPLSLSFSSLAHSLSLLPPVMESEKGAAQHRL